MRVSIVSTAICLSLVGLSAASEVEAAIRRATHIPAQGLGPALQVLAKDHDFQVLYRTQIVGELRTSGAVGELTATEALTKLLSGTGLTYRYLDDKTVTIVPLPVSSRDAASDAAPRGTRSSSPTTEEGKQEERKRGFFDRFRLAQVDQGTSSNGSSVNQQTAATNSGEERIELDEIVVTGTHIRGVKSASPIVVLDRQQIEAIGYSTLDQVTQSLSQTFAGGPQRGTRLGDPSDDAGNNYGGGASVNLRGLGAGATLVLLNGHRLPASSPAGFVDISLIPLSAVERIEVVTDGSSAIYGSDAIAGVVNIILSDDYDGAEVSGRYGSTTKSGFDEKAAELLWGQRWSTGHLLLSYDYRNQGSLDSNDRAFSRAMTDPTDLFGSEEANSVFAAGSRQVGASLRIDGNAYYSTRDGSKRLKTSRTSSSLRSDSTTDQYGGLLGAQFDLPRAWSAELVAGYGENHIDSTSHNITRGRTVLTQFEDHQVSFDAKADGSLWQVPGGEIRLAVGASVRSEEHSAWYENEPEINGSADRTVSGVYAEGFIPLIGADNARPWARRLELTMAARYEKYSDFGDTTNPKVGLVWSPIESVDLRTTFSTSFRAPTFEEIATGYEGDILLELADPAAPGGSSLTLLRAYGANPDLQPEKANNWTTGFDFHPPSVPGLTVQTTYFSIEYKDRIDRPISNFFQALVNASQYPSVVDRTPDPALIAALISRPFTGNSGFLSYVGAFDPADIEVLVDNRNQNFSKTKVSGVDLNVVYDRSLDSGKIHSALNGTYLFHSDQTFGVASQSFDTVDTLSNPADLKLRAELGFSRGIWAVSGAINYVDSYKNPETLPVSKIDSWTTVDLQASLRSEFKVGLLEGVRVALNVQNLFDESPPYVDAPITFFTPLGYDPTNANPIGRFVSLDVKKEF